MARQEISWFMKMIEDSRYGGVRLKHSMSPVGIERALISRSHTERRVISRRLVTRAVLDEQARSVPNEDNSERNRVNATLRVVKSSGASSRNDS